MTQIKIGETMDNTRINKLKEFLESDPGDPFLHYGLALELQKSDAEAAREKYLELLSDFPDYLPTYYHAAHFFWEAEDREKADEIFVNGIELAKRSKDTNTLRELNNAYQNFQFDE